MMNRRALIAAAAAAAMGGGAWWLSRPAPGTELLPFAANAQEATAREASPVEITDIVLGDPDAPVELIEYASFTCPHCATFHANQFKDLKREYIDTGKIRFVFREVYFDRPGLWASMIARCAGETRFHGVVGMIFERQQDWARTQDPNELVSKLMQIGKTAGMTDDELNACMQNADLAASLVGWYEENRAADGIDSTPSIVIDGQKYPNMAFDEIAAILDEKLGEAE